MRLIPPVTSVGEQKGGGGGDKVSRNRIDDVGEWGRGCAKVEGERAAGRKR